MAGKRITGTQITTVIEDGIVTETKKDTSYRLNTEEDYIKLYVRGVSALHGIEGAANKTLHEMLKLVDYKNRITLAPAIKDEIAELAGLKRNTVEHHIIALCKKNLLIKISTNIYTINSYVFGRGKWAEICEHRESLQLNVVFRDGEMEFLPEGKKS